MMFPVYRVSACLHKIKPPKADLSKRDSYQLSVISYQLSVVSF
jgi:hypothetical protein